MGKSTNSSKPSGKGKNGKSTGTKTDWNIKHDSHPGAHDTKSVPNPTLNPDGTLKMGHGHPKMSKEEMSAAGVDKHIQKMHKKSGKSQWGNK
jgi:hypothetical protein